MKKIVYIFFVLLMLITFTGCGANRDASETNSNKIEENDNNEIDVDLTQMSKTMVYSEVFNMMTNPAAYIKEIIKAKGEFATFQETDDEGNPVSDKIYFACLIKDATACCQQGLEFILTDDYKYPEDYPEEGTEITIVGEFHTYMEGDLQYCHLTNAKIVESDQ